MSSLQKNKLNGKEVEKFMYAPLNAVAEYVAFGGSAVEATQSKSIFEK